MAIGSNDHHISLWDLDDLICRMTVPVEHAVKNISYSAEGSHLAVATEGTLLNVVDTTSGSVFKIDCRHSINALAWHPHHALIAIGPDDRSTGRDHPLYLRLVTIPADLLITPPPPAPSVL